LILVDGVFKKSKWKDIVVGDIVKIENKESFAADIIVLSTNDPQGLCYVETSNLDGETNLKIKRAKAETNHLKSEEQYSDFQATIQCEQPNNRLYNFEARMHIPETGRISLDPDQLLLCGSTLRNTEWIIGVIAYTGHETKLMKNRNATPRYDCKFNF
jgi:phospholipid-transporting ATPase